MVIIVNQCEHKHEYSKGVKPIMPDFVTLVRLAITVILLVLAYTISAAQLTSMLMLIAAILISGFDIAISAVYAILRLQEPLFLVHKNVERFLEVLLQIHQL